LSSSAWERLQELVGRFQTAWRQRSNANETVDWKDFQPSPANPLRLPALHKLIMTDRRIIRIG
jgi:hypothetical protein